jgi:hypothetical protein
VINIDSSIHRVNDKITLRTCIVLCKKQYTYILRGEDSHDKG